MRVFLDTNVVISGFATRGLSADVVRLVLTEHTLLTGEVVLSETRRVLLQKLETPRETVDEVEQLLRDHHVEPTPDTPPPVDVSDPDDAVVLSTAIAANADVLVTGDSDLLDVAEHVRAVRIEPPRSFWESVRSGE